MQKKFSAARLVALANVIILTGLIASLFADIDQVYMQRGRSPHLGYGISVGPHLPPRPDMLNEMGLDWVKLYDTVQIPEYADDFKVLYRVDMRGYPDNIDAWERGLEDLARDLDEMGVDAVEIGNEPNLGLEWGGNPPNPAQFADGLCRGYRAFKRAAPRLIVVSGGLAPTAGTPDGMNMDDFDFARAMFRAGAGRCFDAFAYHPYGFNQPPEVDPYREEFSFRRAERMYRLLLEFGVGDKQMWITEFGWVRDPGEGGLNCGGDPNFVNFDWMKFNAQTQADYTVRALQYVQRHWSFAGPLFMWNLDWNLYDAEYEPPCSHLRWYGFLAPDGTKLPVYYAVSNVPKRYTALGSGLLPIVGSSASSLTRTVEAGCASIMRLGDFEIVNEGYPGDMNVLIDPANGPGRPFVRTNRREGTSGTKVEIFVDARDAEPGLHLIAVNLRTTGVNPISSYVVRGWLLVHHPTTPECVANYLEEQNGS